MISNEKRVKELLNGEVIPMNNKGIDYDRMLDEEVSIMRFPFHDERVIFQRELPLKNAAESLAVEDRIKPEWNTSMNIIIGDELLTDDVKFEEAPDVEKMNDVWRDFIDDRLYVYEYDVETNLILRLHPYMKHIESIFGRALENAQENGYSDILSTEYLVDKKKGLVCCIATHTVAWSKKEFDKKVYISNCLSSAYHKKTKTVSTANEKVKLCIDNYDLGHNYKYNDNVYRSLVVGSHVRIEFANVVREAAFAYTKEIEFGDDNLPGVIVGIFKMKDLDKLVKRESNLADKANVIL